MMKNYFKNKELLSPPITIIKLITWRNTETPAECSNLRGSPSCVNGESNHVDGDDGDPLDGGHSGDGVDPMHGGHGVHGESGDGDGGLPAAVLPSPDSPAACAEAHTKWDLLKKNNI